MKKLLNNEYTRAMALILSGLSGFCFTFVSILYTDYLCPYLYHIPAGWDVAVIVSLSTLGMVTCALLAVWAWEEIPYRYEQKQRAKFRERMIKRNKAECLIAYTNPVKVWGYVGDMDIVRVSDNAYALGFEGTVKTVWCYSFEDFEQKVHAFADEMCA